MITMTTHGKNGRLGNQIMQFMSMIGLAKDAGQRLSMPPWEYAKYFNLPEEWFYKGIINNVMNVHEEEFTYNKKFVNYIDDGANYDIKGYLQSEKYWLNAKQDVLDGFTLNEAFEKGIREKNKKLLSSKHIIAIHIRRGDYVNHRSYHNLSILYYINALEDYFSDYLKGNLYHILVFSDDVEYCKAHFDCMPNATVVEGNSDIEDLCLMSMCDSFILSNSTFAWCAAYLSKRHPANKVRPAYYFKGVYAEDKSTKDFWPEDWVTYDHMVNGQPKCIDLKDMSFCIPFYNDHQDRVENLAMTLNFISNHFHTNIKVLEQGGPTVSIPGIEHKSVEGPELMHRTKMLNDMIKESTTPYVANWDTDIIIAPLQILCAVDKLRSGYDIVYPYDGQFNQLARIPWYKMICENYDVGILAGKHQNLQSNGGAVFYNKQSYIEAGMENQYMISFGPEDAERFERFTTLGLDIARQKGPLYHIEHHRGVNSLKKHQYIDTNRAERNKVKAMSKEELTNYIKTWPWLQ